jgi:hypothetical protein
MSKKDPKTGRYPSLQAVEWFLDRSQAAAFHINRPVKASKIDVVWDLLDSADNLSNADLKRALKGQGAVVDYSLFGEIRRSIARLKGAYKPDWTTPRRVTQAEVRQILNERREFAGVPAVQDPSQEFVIAPFTGQDTQMTPLAFRENVVPVLQRFLDLQGWTSLTVELGGAATWEKVVTTSGDI